MSDNIKKLKLIYKPFIIMAIIFISGYTFLNWLILIELELFSLKGFIIKFGLPFTLPWILVLVWLRPKIRVLKLTKGNGNLPFLYQFVAILTIIIPTIIAQEYIETASGKLTAIQSVSEINNQDKTKYYQITNFYIDKMNIGVNTTFDVSGKHSNRFNMHIYIAMPIFESINDTINSHCLIWYGKEYFRSISNKLEEEEKEEKYQEFAYQSQIDFANFDPSQFVYLDRIGNTEDRDGLIGAAKKSIKFDPNYQTILLPINEPFENRNGNKFEWIFGALGIGAIIFLIMLFIPKFDEKELKKLESGKPIKDENLTNFIDSLKPKEGYFITPILIYINIIIFIIMVVSGLGFVSFKGQDLLIWGANYAPSTINGEWWRLLTSTFLHGGLMHLLFNMYGLLFVGIFLEPVLGKTKFLTSYLIAGVLASIASLWWYDATVSVGASGAIFGMYGLFLSLMLTKKFHAKFSKSFLMSTIIFVGFNLLMGLTGGIDNAAHIGGLFSGFIIGLILTPILKKRRKKRKKRW
ncbi:MAG: rhomboid family intramembrane serine protease [Flavobacteriaceae bacterium]|nr:rhomboid family intramembrane serine protease [Flavobacteriaceae bacterium]